MIFDTPCRVENDPTGRSPANPGKTRDHFNKDFDFKSHHHGLH